MSKVTWTDELLKQGWFVYLERSSMRHPRQALLVLGLTQHVMHLLRKGHVLNNTSWWDVLGVRGDQRKVTIGVIHATLDRFNDLNHNWFHGEDMPWFSWNNASSMLTMSHILLRLLLMATGSIQEVFVVIVRLRRGRQRHGR